MNAAEKTRERFYWSTRLTLVGLVVELLSLLGLHHPLGFMTFAAVGCTLMVAGIGLFVVALLASVRTPSEEASE